MAQIVYQNELPYHLQTLSSETVVLVGGCFDLLHPGHSEFLHKAKEQGSHLMVLLESDEAVKQRKGEGRPVNSQQVRAKNLAVLSAVDTVVLLAPLAGYEAYEELVVTISPSIIAVTSGDPYTVEKEKQAKKIGARVVPVLNRLEQHSTTNLINRK